MFLDQGIFQEQGVGFGFHDREFDAVGMFDHHAGLVGPVLPFAEIGRYPVAEIFSLADIEDFILSVEEAINARIFGHGIGYELEIFGGHTAQKQSVRR